MNKINEEEEKRRRRLSHAEVQQAELEMLTAFDGFCRRHGIAYSLAGGTCLGAVRHKGFIPWDDDIDLAVARPDFERLKSLRGELQQEIGLGIRPYGRASWRTAPFLRLESPNIALENPYSSWDGWLWIDLLPVDGLPADGVGRIYACGRFCRSVYRKGLAVPGKGKTALRAALKTIPVFLIRSLHLDLIAARRLDALARKVPYGLTPYVGIVSWGLYGTGERILLKGFQEKTLMPFEEGEFPCMSNWDEYLTGLYGDYMQLPPAEKRKTHEIVAYRVERKSS